jgi:hypothetical protein
MGDEGMWTFDNPPARQLKEKYGFSIAQEWLDHLRLASVRFNDGGSGSFVSPKGLVLTNHHVALGQLQKVSSQSKNYVKDGFYAARSDEEMKCPDLELNVLESLENVTEWVQGVVTRQMSDKEAFRARKAEMARLEKESLDRTGLRSDIVTLYAGGEYWLYRYRRFTDVRLVFAPEQQAAFYGGDPDNFTYPRYALDIALFRVYENDKPVKSPHYLQWGSKGAVAGELVFVSGHPGYTERLTTFAALEYERDHFLPSILSLLERRIGVLRRYAERGPEQARQATSQVFGIENSLKALKGELDGLRDKSLITKKQSEESEFRRLVAARPELKKQFGSAWDEIAEAGKKEIAHLKELRFRSLRGARIPSLALTLVQYAAEIKKPDAERLEGFHESQLESLRFRLFSPAPVYEDLEIVLLTDSLQESLDQLGSGDPFVKAALEGRSPAEVAAAVMKGTKLGNPAVRRSLAEEGEPAIAASNDPAIVLARRLDPIVREMRRWMEDNIQSVETAAGEKIGKARFAVFGKGVYPDATFTLRLAYGTVKGYAMNGTIAPPKTTFFGLYDRANGFAFKSPFDLPARFIERKDRINLAVPLNFVTTCDVVGGNSGSPVVNRSGAIVGLIFDGNIESLVGSYVYVEENNRSVAVDTAAIIEALRKIYDAAPLAEELEGSN